MVKLTENPGSIELRGLSITSIQLSAETHWNDTKGHESGVQEPGGRPAPEHDHLDHRTKEATHRERVPPQLLFTCLVKFNSKGWRTIWLILNLSGNQSLRRSRLPNSLGGRKDSHMAQRKTSFLSVSGRHNCAASSLKKFTNICKLSEIISLKLFHKPWNETVRALLRSKGFCYPLVNSNEILLKVNSWN